MRPKGEEMKLFAILVGLSLKLSCGNQDKTTQTQRSKQPLSTHYSQSKPTAPSPQNAAVSTITGSVTLAAEEVSMKAGTSGCLKITVADFSEILATQYTLQWDPQILQFQKLQNFNLPYLSPQNFGTPLTAQGKLTCVWLDDSLQGVSRSDGAVIYEICFKGLERARGKTSTIEFVEEPTPFEAVNAAEKVLPINPVHGAVKVY